MPQIFHKLRIYSDSKKRKTLEALNFQGDFGPGGNNGFEDTLIKLNF